MLAATSSPQNVSNTPQLQIDDVIVFVALESLGTMAITGNICLVVVLLRNKYLQRASFILMLSLAIADIIHGIVTTSFFYPPIILRTNHMPRTGVKIFNILDWTAWSITLTHMSAICLDRLIAILLYGRYGLIVTVKRIRFFTLFCWISFFSINTIYIFALKACCLITPLANNQFYTFGYGEFETKEDKQNAIFNGLNLFTFTYSPLEMTTLAILSVSNPTTLVQLYRRHKRKIALRIQAPPASRQTNSSLKTRSQWQRASTMLLEMSMRMGSKQINNDVRNIATRRQNRQQQRILLQISVVACLFYFYMGTYYLLYHWVVLFNSFFYSVTHMMNPLIYFSLNKEMRVQLIKALNDFLGTVCCIEIKTSDNDDSQRKPSTEQRSSTKGVENSITINETSPLFNANLVNNNNGRPALIISTSSGVEKLRISEFSASLKRLVNHNNSATLTRINISTTTEELVDSSTNDESSRERRRSSQRIDLKEFSNGALPNGKHQAGHKNSGYVEEPSLGRLTTDESEEDTRLLTADESEKSENQQSLLKSIVKAMHRVVLFDSHTSSSKAAHSQSLDQIASKRRQPIKFSRTIHAFSELSRSKLPDQQISKSHSFTNEMAFDENEETKLDSSDKLDNCEHVLRSSLVLLINESDTNPTITTVQELDQSKYTPGETPEDDVIFL
ncbi:hypothetical protein M3Y97_00820400 [Aphelenchoides bicaudatus]|nr:hypothetical protein M3Y97_00820400 [Aphelenchoides bicaudatus]